MGKFFIIILLAVATVTGIGIDKSFAGEGKGAERKVSYWVAPMDSNYRRDKPGKSPMGMDLVPVYADDVNGSNDNAVFLSPSVINNLGVRTAKVKKESFRSQINAVGYVGYDETKIEHVHTRSDGWIEKTYVHYVGQEVKKGDLLFEYYSTEIVNAQSEYIQSLIMGHPAVVVGAKERLRAFGFKKDQIKEIKKSRKIGDLVKVFANQGGVITKLKATQGMHVRPEDEVIRIAVYPFRSSWTQRGVLLR